MNEEFHGIDACGKWLNGDHAVGIDAHIRVGHLENLQGRVDGLFRPWASRSCVRHHDSCGFCICGFNASFYTIVVEVWKGRIQMVWTLVV